MPIVSVRGNGNSRWNWHVKNNNNKKKKNKDRKYQGRIGAIKEKWELNDFVVYLI